MFKIIKRACSNAQNSYCGLRRSVKEIKTVCVCVCVCVCVKDRESARCAHQCSGSVMQRGMLLVAAVLCTINRSCMQSVAHFTG